MVNDINEPEAEFHFRYELEVGEVEVASEAACEIEVAALELDIFAALACEVNGGHDAGGDVGAEVAVTQRREFQVEREHEIGRLEVLLQLLAGVGLAEAEIAVAEIKSGRESHVEVGAETHVEQTVDIEAGLERWLLHKP